MSYKFLRFGIETEFLLTPRDGKDYKNDIEAFVKYVRGVYQSGKNSSWPNMHLDNDGVL